MAMEATMDLSDGPTTSADELKSAGEEEEVPLLLDDASAALLAEEDDEEETPSDVPDEPEEGWEEAEQGGQVEDRQTSRLEAGPHTVQQGECLADIAFRAGHLPETIWKHARNANLRDKRKDDAFLLPGDTIYIPHVQPRWVTGATGRRHRFVLKDVPARVELRPLVLGAPRAGQRFVLEVDGRRIEDTTDDQGWIRVPIQPSARRGQLTLESGEPIEVLFGQIDPVEEVTGAQARLCNLGYECALSGKLDDTTREALEVFQEDNGLEVTGENDAATRAKLVELHGS
jgi:hypothetical protein